MTIFRLLFTQLIYYIDLNKTICHTDIKSQREKKYIALLINCTQCIKHSIISEFSQTEVCEEKVVLDKMNNLL